MNTKPALTVQPPMLGHAWDLSWLDLGAALIFALATCATFDWLAMAEQATRRTALAVAATWLIFALLVVLDAWTRGLPRP